tara:strand:+ start:589 stop:690 length:102 start_codon:yes stop_codon:yes gene_type:complete
MNNIKKYLKIAKDNPKVTAGVVIVAIILLNWIF